MSPTAISSDSAVSKFAQTQAALKTHAFSGRALGDYQELVLALLEVKQAAASANLSAGDISQSEFAAINQGIEACKSMQSEFAAWLPADAWQGGGGIAINVNINEWLAHVIAPKNPALDLAAWQKILNRSQSTADVVATASRVALIRTLPCCQTALEKAAAALADKATAFAQVTTLATTCLQDAFPVPISALFSGWSVSLSRHAEQMRQATNHLHAVNLGGTVIGTGDGASAAYRDVVINKLAAITNLPLTRTENLYDAAQNSDDLVALSKIMASTAAALIKICKDLRLLASGPTAGFHEIVLPKVIQGSSFFSDKNNPTLPETTLQCCFQILGAERAIAAAKEHSDLYLNVFEVFIAIQLMESADILARSISNLNAHCLAGINVNTERCRDLVASKTVASTKRKERR